MAAKRDKSSSQTSIASSSSSTTTTTTTTTTATNSTSGGELESLDVRSINVLQGEQNYQGKDTVVAQPVLYVYEISVFNLICIMRYDENRNNIKRLL